MLPGFGSFGSFFGAPGGGDPVSNILKGDPATSSSDATSSTGSTNFGGIAFGPQIKIEGGQGDIDFQQGEGGSPPLAGVQGVVSPQTIVIGILAIGIGIVVLKKLGR